MAVLAMKRIEIIALQSDAKSIVELLQRRGVVEIQKHQVTADEPAIQASLLRFQNQSSMTQFDKNLQSVDNALAALKLYAPAKKSIIDSYAGRQELSLTDFSQKAKLVEVNLRKAHTILSLSKKIDAAHTVIDHTKTQIEALLPWENLDIPMQYEGSEHTVAFIGSLPALYSEESLKEGLVQTYMAAAANTTGSTLDLPDVWIEIVSATREISCTVVMCQRSDESTVRATLRELGFTLPSDPTKHPPVVRINRLRKKIAQSQEEIEELTGQLIAYKEDREALEFVSDYLLMRRDKYDTLGNLHFSRQTFILDGYIPVRNSQDLVNELSNLFDVAITLTDPAEEDDVPVALKNNNFAYPLEDITEAYSLPSKRDIDPNFIMSFFYYAFFGMMLSDAGYGLIIVIATACILHFKKPEGSKRQNMMKFLYCGLSTIFWGAMYGSWFGNLVHVVSITFLGKDFSLQPIWFDPVNDPLKLLIFSLILGFIHVMTGLVIKFYLLWKNGGKLDALFDIGFWWVIFLGLGLVIANGVISVDFPLQSLGLYMAAAGAAGLVLTQGRASKSIAGKILGGVASLYSITGYFSDILSYSRLMALGLVTGIIGTVVNTIGSINGGGVGGAIMFILVFILGHSINIGINLLGAYVHGNRLQYVEFFSKFYEGGGRAFKPFGVRTNHFKFKEDK